MKRVLIIGGGVIGLCTAYYAANPVQEPSPRLLGVGADGGITAVLSAQGMRPLAQH